jgi:endonuclease/exonuclease/phosphatase (EEP) superfamily protein YafD
MMITSRYYPLTVMALTLTGCVQAPFHQHETSGSDITVETHLRVLVWNVLHGANDVDKGAEKALAIIRSVEPDIVLLQESYDMAGWRAWLESASSTEHSSLCVDPDGIGDDILS